MPGFTLFLIILTNKMRSQLFAALRILLLLAVAGCLPGTAFAGNYVLKNYTDQDGLPQNSVGGIVVDRDNYTWLVTQDGCVRFDGNNFVVYNKSNIPGLKSNRFSNFRFDRLGNLYVFNDENQYLRLSAGKVYMDSTFKERSERQLYGLGFKDHDSYWVRGNTGWFDLLIKKKYFYLDTSGQVFECNGAGVRFFKNDHFTGNILFQGPEMTRYFILGSDLYYVADNGTLSRIRNNGIRSFKLTGDICKNTYYQQHPDSAMIYWNGLGQNPVVYCNNTFYLLEQSRDGLMTTLLYADVIINENAINSVYYESVNHRLFIGSSTNGLYIISPRKFSVLKANIPGWQDVYYAHTYFTGNKILTSQGMLLSRDDNSSPAALYIKAAKDRYGILTDRHGNIWKKEGDLLYKYSPGMQLLDQWAADDEITDIYEGVDGRIWMGIGRRYGALKATKSDGPLAPVSIARLSASISYMQQKNKDTLWVGTVKGVYCLNTKNGTVAEITGLHGKYIRSLYLRSPDELWVATYEDGLFFYNNRELVSLPVDRDNYLKTAHCIIEDLDGYFWIGTNKGLFQASRTDMLRYTAGLQDYVFYQYYNKDDGFITNEFNGGCQPCGLNWSDGSISLPSLNGIVCFNPQRIRYEWPSAAIYIDQVIVDKQIFDVTGNSMQLPRSFEQLKIHLSTPYYGNHKNVQMQYALSHNGLKTQWYDVGKNNEIIFTHLGSGTYTLLVRKINGFGLANESDLELSFIVAPRFYEAWWFYVLVLLSLGLAIYIYIRIRLRYVVKRNKELETQVAKRTSNLNNALEQLKHSEVQLRRQNQLQEKIVAAIGHDIKSPLRFIALANQKIHEHLEAEEADRARYISKEAFAAATKTYHHISNFVEYVKTQMQQGRVDMKAIPLHEIVAEKAEIFNPLAENKSMRIVNDIPEGIMVWSDAQLLAVVIHNLLDNAIKYGRKGQVRLYVTEESGAVAFAIRDEGKGMDAATASWLSAAADTPAEYNVQGLGLLMVKELCVLLRIRVRVDRSAGTLVQLVFDPPA